MDTRDCIEDLFVSTVINWLLPVSVKKTVTAAWASLNRFSEELRCWKTNKRKSVFFYIWGPGLHIIVTTTTSPVAKSTFRYVLLHSEACRMYWVRGAEQESNSPRVIPTPPLNSQENLSTKCPKNRISCHSLPNLNPQENEPTKFQTVVLHVFEWNF